MDSVDRRQTCDVGGDPSNAAALNFDHDPEVEPVANLLPVKYRRDAEDTSIVERANATSYGHLFKSDARGNRPVRYSTVDSEDFHDLQVDIVKTDARPASALPDRR